MNFEIRRQYLLYYFNFKDLSTNDTIEMAISSLKSSTDSDPNPNDIEIGVVTSEDGISKGLFKKLTADEIEVHLNEIRTKD